MIQTPRLKTKLSLDIPSGYSNDGFPDSPTSQFSASFSASPVFTPTRPFDNSVPPSPTFSGTLNSSRSQAELTVLLKEAYGVIREREKDLTLAAEIGKSLLENNIALKGKYESAIVQLQHLQRARSKAATFTIQHQIGEKHATPIAPPKDSLDNLDEYDESDSESLADSTSFDLSSPGDIPYRRKNRNSSSLNYKELENIKELETRNQELQQQLDEAIREYNDADKSNKTKIRKLETDLQHFHDAYALATQKIDDLEKETERLIQKQKADFWNLKYSKKSNDNEDFIETLLHKVQELEDQNNLVEKAKLEIDRRLARTTKDLEALKEEYSELVEKSKDYEMVQLKNHDQEKLIAELYENLEEQRALVVSYRSGMLSQRTSRANSVSDGGIFQNALRRLSNPDGMRDIFGGLPKQPSLLSELENEWMRVFQQDVKRGRGDSESSSPSFSPITSEKDLTKYFLDGREDEMDYLSDDEFSFLDEFEIDNEKANRLREWFWKRWARAVYRFLRKIWRWCRFIVILIAAVLMALYRGPDDVLPNDI